MRHWTLISAALCFLIGYIIQDRNMLGPFVGANGGNDLRAFLGLIAQISVTMLGFLLAALAILASISGSRLVRNMKRTGHYSVLLSKFFWNVIAYGVATGLALIAYLAKSSLGLLSNVALVFFFFSSLLLVDVGYRFWLVLSSIGDDK